MFNLSRPQTPPAQLVTERTPISLAKLNRELLMGSAQSKAYGPTSLPSPPLTPPPFSEQQFVKTSECIEGGQVAETGHSTTTLRPVKVEQGLSGVIDSYLSFSAVSLDNPKQIRSVAGEVFEILSLQVPADESKLTRISFDYFSKSEFIAHFTDAAGFLQRAKANASKKAKKQRADPKKPAAKFKSNHKRKISKAISHSWRCVCAPIPFLHS